MRPVDRGLRMAVDVGAEECFRLARAMTLKNAAAVLSESRARQIVPREAAFAIATRRLREAMGYRRWGIS